MPDAVGVPLIVIISDAHAAVKPSGRSVGVPIPVAPVVEWVMAVKGVLMHNVGVADAVPEVISEVTIICPVAFMLPQPPVNGML